MTRKPTLYGPDGRQIPRVMERHAPNARQRAGLEGWVSWGLIDRKGREVTGGEQHNLILDTFLNEIAATPIDPPSAFFSHFAVGTGSTAPNETDTALDNEIARTTTQIASSVSRSADGVYQLVVEREFDFTEGNGNLTEFGFAGGSSSPMLVRELFRDGGGNPITVTKTSDYKLRIRYELELALTPVLPTPGSFTITGIGVVNGDFRFIGGPDNSTFRTDLAAFGYLTRAFVTPRGNGGGFADADTWPVYEYPTSIRNLGTDDYASVNTHSTFTPGAWERSLSVTFGTGRANKLIASLGVLGREAASGVNPRQAAGFVFNIDEGDRFTKDNLHTLTINDLVTVSWGRA